MLITIFSSFVNFNIDSTQKKKQQSKRFFSHFNESDTDFIIGQSSHEAQAGSKTNVVDISTSSNNLNSPIQGNNPQADMHTLLGNIVSRVRTEVDNVMMAVETSLQDVLLTAREKLVIPRVELAMKSANAF